MTERTLWDRKIDGFTVTARVEYDDTDRTPWQEEDGHGPVTDWLTRPKYAGERVLAQSYSHRRHYDFAEACRIAYRDGWGCVGGIREGETRKAYAARAAEEDFRRLRAWCRDEWYYVGVVLSVSRGGVELDKYAAALWGIESDAEAYILEVAEELLSGAIDAARNALQTVNEGDAT
jgi:hypothetical protein